MSRQIVGRLPPDRLHRAFRPEPDVLGCAAPGKLRQVEPSGRLAFRVGGDPWPAGIDRAREIDQVDVLMAVLDVFELDAGGTYQLAWCGDWDSGIADELDFHANFFAGFPQRGLVRQLAWLDMSAGREPLLQLAMPEQRDAPVVNDEDGDGEVTRWSIGWLAKVHVHGRRLYHGRVTRDA